MKKLFTITIALFTAYSGFSQTHVNGYYRSNGTYVAPHYRSSPNYTKADNWSTLGNVNPFTGSLGTRTYSDFYNSSYYNSISSIYSSSTFTGTIGLPSLTNMPSLPSTSSQPWTSSIPSISSLQGTSSIRSLLNY
jgi:hypothetical protein